LDATLWLVTCSLLAGCTAASPTASSAAPSTAATKQGPTPSERRLQQARELQLQGRWAESRPLLERVVADSTKDVEAWRRLGEAQLNLARATRDSGFREARASLERCLELSPQDADCHFLLGRALESLAEPQAGLSHYFEALRLAPESPTHYERPVELCLLYREAQTARALAEYGLGHLGTAEANASARRALHLLRYRAFEQQGDTEGMIDAVERAEREPGEAPPYTELLLGRAYLRREPQSLGPARDALQRFASDGCQGELEPRRQRDCDSAAALLRAIPTTPPVTTTVVSPPPPLVAPPFPELPTLSRLPETVGDALTVWGAGMRLRRSLQEFTSRFETVTVQGWIAALNLDQVPRCALHRPGVADPVGCTAPIPTFWLCDAPDASRDQCVRVVGWASNWAQLWGALESERKESPEPYIDDYWGVAIPRPAPRVGGPVRVTGRLDETYSMTTVGVEVDSVMGLFTLQKLEWVTPPTQELLLPGMKPARPVDSAPAKPKH